MPGILLAADRELNDATAMDAGDAGDGSPYAMSPHLYRLMHIEAPKYEFQDHRTGYHRVGAHLVERDDDDYKAIKPRDPKAHIVASADGAASGKGGKKGDQKNMSLIAAAKRKKESKMVV